MAVGVAIVRVLAVDLAEARVEPPPRELLDPLVPETPSGSWNRGRNDFPSESSTLHISAMRSVLSIASRKSGSAATMSSGDWMKRPSVSWRSRLILERLVRRDAHEDVVRLRVLAADVVGIGRRDERDALVAPELRELGVHVELLAHPVRLHLEEERAGLEDVAVLARDAARAVHVALPREAAPRRQAGGEADEALRVVAQELLVDARVVVEALGERLRGEEAQVRPALRVLQQDEVPSDALRAIVPTLVARDVGLHAHDGLHAGVLRLLVEVHRAEEVSVIRHGDALHALRLDGLEEVLDGSRRRGGR